MLLIVSHEKERKCCMANLYWEVQYGVHYIIFFPNIRRNQFCCIINTIKQRANITQR
jgi:hypothetical protein